MTNQHRNKAVSADQVIEESHLKRHLKSRHILLMALGSTIGVGLFLGSGTAIAHAGPSILLAYLLAGVVAFIVLRALGEMAVHNPIAGSFAHYAHEYVGPLAGYLVGWGYWFYWVIVGVAEVSAVGIYMGIWFPEMPQWIWAISSLIFMGGLNFIAVKLFGEFEFWFALIKVFAIIAIIAFGGMVIFFGLSNGGVPLGLTNLWANGGFFPTGFDGFLFSLQMALFAYVGIEMIGLSAGEAENPEKTLPMAIDSLIIRIVVFYGGALLVILCIYPWNEMGSQGSPFVVMFERMGLKEAAGVVNFVVITAALSSCNAGIFSGGRLLMGLAQKGFAPAQMKKISKTGVPSLAVIATVSTAIVGSILNFFVPEKAFIWATSAVTLIGLCVWLVILMTQLQFRKKLSQEQLDGLTYKSILWPYSIWFAIAFILLVIFIMCIHPEGIIGLIVGVPIILFLVLIYYLKGFNKKEYLGQKTN